MGGPNPKRWYVLARNRNEAGLLVKNPLYSITIADGQLSEAKRYVDARQIFNRRNFINIPSVRIDSSVAFSIARNALGPAAQGMRSASYQLTQTGRSADPIWDVWGYGSSNRYLGVVRLSATDWCCHIDEGLAISAALIITGRSVPPWRTSAVSHS